MAQVEPEPISRFSLPKARFRGRKMSVVSEEQRFSQTVKVLSEAIVYSVGKIYEKVPAEATEKGIVAPGTAQMIAMVVSGLDPKTQIETFIKHTSKYWEQIRKKDREFFLVNAGKIFIPLQVINVKMSIFMDIVTLRDPAGEPVIHSDIEDQIWELFHSMVKISLKYIHRQRNPYRRTTPEGGETRGYWESFMPELDLHQMIENWGVKVVWPELTNA